LNRDYTRKFNAFAIFAILFFGSFTFAIPGMIPEAYAAAVNWDGGGDGINWSDPLNWDTDTVPTGTDSITILNSAGDVRMNIDFTLEPGGFLTILNTVPRLLIDPNIIFTNNGDVTVEDGALLFNFVGLLENNGLVNIFGAYSSQGGTLNNLPSGSINNIGSTPATGMFLDFVTTTNNWGIINNAIGHTIFVGWTLNNYNLITNAGTFTGQGHIINNLEGGVFQNDGIFELFPNTFTRGATGNRNTLTNDVGAVFNNLPGSSFTTDADVHNQGSFVFAGTTAVIRDTSPFELSFNNLGSLDEQIPITNNGVINTCHNGTFVSNTPGGTLVTDCKIWDGEAGDGLWSSALNWNGNTLPAAEDVIILTGAGQTVRLDTPFTLRELLVIEPGVTFAIDNGVTLMVTGGDLDVLAGATLDVFGFLDTRPGIGSTISNYGIINIVDELQLGPLTFLFNLLSGTINNAGVLDIQIGTNINTGGGLHNQGSLFNAGDYINAGRTTNLGSIVSCTDSSQTTTLTGRLTGNAITNDVCSPSKFWDGGAAGVWSDPLNWSNDTLPTGSDDIIIDGNVIVTLDTSFTLSTGTLTIASGSELIIGSGGSLSNNSTNTITINGLLTINGGQTLFNFATGTIEVTSSGQINNLGTIDNNGGTINNSGTITISPTGLATGISNGNGATINNFATGIITLSAGGGGTAILSTSSSTINNSGDINVSGGVFSNQAILNNSGTITISNNGPLINTNGIINNNSGGIIDISSTLSSQGTINNNVGATITILNSGGGVGLANSGGNTLNNFGTITISDTGGNGIGILNTFDSTFDNSGTITISNISGDGIRNGGTFDNSGTITIQNSGGNGGIVNSNSSNLGTINNSGTITISNTGGTGIFNSGGTIDNTNGIININFTGTIDNTSGTIDNTNGTINNNCGTIIGPIIGNPVNFTCDAAADFSIFNGNPNGNWRYGFNQIDGYYSIGIVDGGGCVVDADAAGI